MNQIAIDLLTKERVCVLSVVLADGSPHAAALHYSQQIDPVKLFIQTYPTVKTRAILEGGGAAKAAVVIGFNEQDFLTLQMRGMVNIVSDPAKLEEIYKIHYAKHPEAEKYKSSRTIFLEFTPTWWRYSDLKTDPETIIENA
ncbi:MAG: hypothetical protein A3A27_00140 [Candidatus Wildermuthbacteria bacterium RIFCSPLOWO2_01_FULL_47_18]|uniref:Pyridoxamine 5'-phosphate oxidase N-terminal domain-containing protein n=2 Tax=Candidatus Wildermuthiibacteriota TaxID=1817923 RepID=A0A1G2RIS4_9BACT|nr:MAG: hypothetical protein A3J68_01210 [Candidatus Wildermuthbacteria bacterium RIFCSPHIGHO2_02_FULL_48_16]OHA72753.1 MAG: hypothetical protein A3A27_00140 [Candidatus Wildermuthbacteria bacterium RIFCSPLOWO2_01_FULL_47_18]